MKNDYLDVVNQCILDGKKLNLDNSELAFFIIYNSEKFDDEYVWPVLQSLPEDIKREIFSSIESYKETKKYYVVSSAHVMDTHPP